MFMVKIKYERGWEFSLVVVECLPSKLQVWNAIFSKLIIIMIIMIIII